MHLMLDIDTKHFTLYRHIIAASGMQKNLNRLYSSNEWFEAIKGKCELPWSRLIRSIFIDEQHKAVGQGTKVEATQVSYSG